MREDLIAPCGMNCEVCSAYLAFKNSIPKVKGKITYCKGCRPRQKQCAYLKGHCPDKKLNSLSYCFECDVYPCKRLIHLDERYRTRFNASLLTNLEDIKAMGIEGFLQNEKKKYSCIRCGAYISVHNRKCYRCDIVDDWKT